MSEDVQVQPLAWPIPQAAKRAGFGETKFREAIDRGEIAYVQNGDRKLIEDEEIKRWLASKRQKAA
jgi:excisionase family DNA binding protein